VRPFIPIAYRPETYLPIKVPGFGLIIAFTALTVLGFLTANLVGRTMVEIGETILERVPIVRPLYRGLKQVFETLFSKSGSSFRTVALVEFPAPGMWSLVFPLDPARTGHHREAAERGRICFGLHAVHAEPDHGVLLLRAQARRHRARALGRGCGQAADERGMIQPGGSPEQHRKLAAAGAKRARGARGAHPTRRRSNASGVARPEHMEAGARPARAHGRQHCAPGRVAGACASVLADFAAKARTFLPTILCRSCCSAARRKAGSGRPPT